MGKSLVNLLNKTLLIASMAIPLTFAGCKEKNYPPEAKLEVNPVYGEVPFNVRMKVTGSDLNGNEDIKEYKLNINNEVVKSTTPIDITRTFENPGTIKVYGEIFDYENESGKTNTSTIEAVRGTFIKQSATIENDAEIKYSATLSKVDKAELKVNKNGTQIFSYEVKDISENAPDYEKTFKNSTDGITKGNYEFILKSTSLEDKVSLTIPNHTPSMNASGLKTDLEELSKINVTLPLPTDKNPEDNPVSITSVKSLDGKTQLTLNGKNLEIKAVGSNTGGYSFEVNYGNSTGGVGKSVVQGNITPGNWKYVVNPFVSTNDNGKPFDLLTTKAQRDAYVQSKLNEDWVNTMTPSTNPEWDCTEYSNQSMINFHGFPDLTGYSGNNIDSIYFYHKTLKDNGKYGLPMFFVIISADIPHNMNAILTGNDLTNFDDWNYIEPQLDKINVKPGQYFMPNNCEIEIRAPPKTKDGKYLFPGTILKYKIQNGIPTLISENTDEYLKLIKNR